MSIQLVIPKLSFLDSLGMVILFSLSYCRRYVPWSTLAKPGDQQPILECKSKLHTSSVSMGHLAFVVQMLFKCHLIICLNAKNTLPVRIYNWNHLVLLFLQPKIDTKDTLTIVIYMVKQNIVNFMFHI